MQQMGGTHDINSAPLETQFPLTCLSFIQTYAVNNDFTEYRIVQYSEVGCNGVFLYFPWRIEEVHSEFCLGNTIQ
jgi:hypothetical protein